MAEKTAEANDTFDLIVIGGGPAGYAGAIRAGQLGKKVLCIEAERAGGTCLNWGCIPSKALLKSAELYSAIQGAEDFGLSVKGVSFDFSKVVARSRGVADQMAKGIEFLFKKNKVTHVKGLAHIPSAGTVEIVEGEEGVKGKKFKAEKILIATGCKARALPDIPVDGVRVMTSREALAMKAMPKSITILGAGAIGVEFAYFLSTLGCKVTLVEMANRIVPVEDAEISEALERSFAKQGINCITGVRAENIQVGKKSVKLDLITETGKDAGKKQTIENDSLLLAIGVVPNIHGLVGAEVRLDADRGYLKVDGQYKTNVPGIYAAGDIIGPPWLAHVATYEAVQAVNGMFGASAPKRVESFPGCTYCQPQVASVGLTEAAVKAKGVKYKVGKFPFAASGKAVASNHSEGFVKLIVCEQYGEILGAHIIGSEATEMIAEYGLAVNMEATAEDISETIHAHPTLSEAMMEAAAATAGEAIHI